MSAAGRATVETALVGAQPGRMAGHEKHLPADSPEEEYEYVITGLGVHG